MKLCPSTYRSSYLVLVAFVLLALVAGTTPFFSFDLDLTRIIQGIRLPFFDILMKSISSIGSGRAMPMAVIAIVSFFIFLNLKLEAIYLSVSSFTALLAGNLAKIMVSRPRPVEGLVSIYKHLSYNSFPSSHTLTYTVIFGFLFFVALARLKPSWKKSLVLGLSAFLILTVGVSRIYLGAHWPSDVLGGYLLGFFFLTQTIRIYKTHGQR
jgi:undecaprenyl-diphosphatase